MKGRSSSAVREERSNFTEGCFMRGRWPSGPEYIDQLQGAVEEKERLKTILATLSGDKRVLQACAELGIGETRFHQLRQTALQAALAALARRPAGRPRRVSSPESEQVRRQQQRLEELELAVQEAQVREEIALVLAHGRGGDAGGAATEKKGRRPRVKVRKPR
jgi:hypothetical protein